MYCVSLRSLFLFLSLSLSLSLSHSLLTLFSKTCPYKNHGSRKNKKIVPLGSKPCRDKKTLILSLYFMKIISLTSAPRLVRVPMTHTHTHTFTLSCCIHSVLVDQCSYNSERTGYVKAPTLSFGSSMVPRTCGRA